MSARPVVAPASRTTPPSRPLLVCIHDAAPPFARETEAMIRDLTPLVGRRLAVGVVPDWHGQWPLARLLEEPELDDAVRKRAIEWTVTAERTVRPLAPSPRLVANAPGIAY